MLILCDLERNTEEDFDKKDNMMAKAAWSFLVGLSYWIVSILFVAVCEKYCFLQILVLMLILPRHPVGRRWELWLQLQQQHW